MKSKKGRRESWCERRAKLSRQERSGCSDKCSGESAEHERSQWMKKVGANVGTFSAVMESLNVEVMPGHCAKRDRRDNNRANGKERRP